MISNSVKASLDKIEPVVWRGQKYLAIPIQIESVEIKSDGLSNRPTLTIDNGAGYITGILNQYRGLVGAIVTRYCVPAQFLDAINFIDGNDHAIASHEMDKDKCSKRLGGCQARFGLNGQLPFGGFPMTDKVSGN